MITSQFKQFLYSKTMDTALVAAAECAEVGALVDEVYQSFLGNELNNNSGKTKATLKIVLLNLYSYLRSLGNLVPPTQSHRHRPAVPLLDASSPPPTSSHKPGLPAPF